MAIGSFFTVLGLICKVMHTEVKENYYELNKKDA